MGARIIDGKAIAAELRERITDRVARLSDTTVRPPGLAVIRVGEDPASRVYVTKKRQDCAQVGIRSFNHDLPEQTSESALLELLARLNDDPAVDGTLVQLPLPQHMDPQKVIAAIDPDKDVDGFHPTNVGRLTLRLPGLRSCTPRGVMTLLEHTDIPLEGRDAVIVGQSNIVGRPMALELLNARCTVTICHSRTRELEAKVRGADVLVAAVGREAFIPGAWIKPGATVIDVGINRNADGKLVGDVDFAGAAEQAGWITPVPGGVGPMTRASLLANTLQAHEAREGLT